MAAGWGDTQRAAALSAFYLSIASLLSYGTADGATANSYGIVSGIAAAATANTAALRSLVSPTANGGAGTFVGEVTFPDGAIYYFNDVIPVRDNIAFDLKGSTLHFSKTPPDSVNDVATGFIFAIRNFSIANGTLEVDYNGTGISNAGNALMLGQRHDNGGVYFQPSLDSQLPSPMGNITVSNIKINTDNPSGACGIGMYGGLQSVIIQQVTINGMNQLICGIYYEYGQATLPLPRNPQNPPPFTSHAHGLTLSGITIENLVPVPPTGSTTLALSLVGAYDTLVDGLTVTGPVDQAFFGSAGEASFYKMWPTQVAPIDRTITLRNVTASQARVSAVSLGGAGSFSGGYLGQYLSPSSYSAANETDELNYILSNFNLTQAAGSSGWGIFTNARSVTIGSGTVAGFGSGIAITDDCTMIYIDGVTVKGSGSQGIRIQSLGSIWTPARYKTGHVANSIVEGSGVASAGSAAIGIDWANGFLFDKNTFGYKSETTQGNALAIGANASNIISHENDVLSTFNGAPAYISGTSSTNGNTVQGDTGVTSTQGHWTVASDVAPVLTKDLVGATINAGANLTLMATFSGTITSYVWLRNGIAVPGATGNSLSLTNVTEENAGSYQLLAKNLGATGSSSVVTVAIDKRRAVGVIDSYIEN